MLHTPLCDLLGIQYPVMCAGMNTASTADLVGAVSNCGGIGTLGGLMLSPAALEKEIQFLKEVMAPGKPFGVDLAFPKIGEGARKTNYDYTHGHFDELIDITIREKAKLFVCAIGVPPVDTVEKLHKAGIVVMNMIGAPKHVDKALAVGVDIVCAQGTEGGGHTGEVGTMALIPMCVDRCRGKKNYFGSPIQVVAAGGIFDGRGLAAALALGATGVWVGTRFVATPESSAPKGHKEKILKASATDTIRTDCVTGRPLRLVPNAAVKYWESEPAKKKELLDGGMIPMLQPFLDESEDRGKIAAFEALNSLSGQAAGGFDALKPAAEIVETMVREALAIIKHNQEVYAKL